MESAWHSFNCGSFNCGLSVRGRNEKYFYNESYHSWEKNYDFILKIFIRLWQKLHLKNWCKYNKEIVAGTTYVSNYVWLQTMSTFILVSVCHVCAYGFQHLLNRFKCNLVSYNFNVQWYFLREIYHIIFYSFLREKCFPHLSCCLISYSRNQNLITNGTKFHQ